MSLDSGLEISTPSIKIPIDPRGLFSLLTSESEVFRLNFLRIWFGERTLSSCLLRVKVCTPWIYGPSCTGVLSAPNTPLEPYNSISFFRAPILTKYDAPETNPEMGVEEVYTTSSPSLKSKLIAETRLLLLIATTVFSRILSWIW